MAIIDVLVLILIDAHSSLEGAAVTPVTLYKKQLRYFPNCVNVSVI